MMHKAVKLSASSCTFIHGSVVSVSVVSDNSAPSWQWTDRGVNGSFSVGQKNNDAPALLKLPLELCFQNT